VVVAIIALLIAILVPSLKAAREQAKITMCLTNLHDFGAAMHQYAMQYEPYFPLTPYIGSSIYCDRPGADDNLFVLYLARLTPNVSTFTCPSTKHRIRKPRRIEKVREGNGTRFDIYCDPNSNEVRNDFEMHGILLTEWVVDPSYRRVQVNGFGTSYEYSGWVDSASDTEPKEWYPWHKKPGKQEKSSPMTTRNVKFPAKTTLLQDADEGSDQGVVVGAPPSVYAWNNYPEPWDNHGAVKRNYLQADGHVFTNSFKHTDPKDYSKGYWLIRN
jgi:type II secretory pathway pseudopilin PulG